MSLLYRREKDDRTKGIAMTAHRYNTKKVCSKQIRFEIEDGTLHNVRFLGGGCEGNLKAMGMLLEGADAKQTSEMLRGTGCGNRGTSCGDQLAIAIDLAMQKEENPE